MKSRKVNETKVLLANVRLSYANIFEPKAFEGQEPKYSVSLIIDKNDKDTIKLINEAIESARSQGAEKFWNGKIPKSLKMPLRDGDEERDEDEAYQNAFFINANSKTAPQVVGTVRSKATGKCVELGSDDVYSGCYANVSINFYPYNNISKGVAAGLGNIQKCADGEPLGAGRTKAEDEFDFEEIDEDEDFLF